MQELEACKEDKIFDSWSLYQKVIKYNYMFHEEMYASLEERLPKREGLRVLDLGCGDASAISSALKKRDVSTYVGIDLSKDALKYAEINLKVLGCDVELIEADFLEGVKGLEEEFDVIVAGYSLHHLQKDEVEVLFSEVKERLVQSGHFLYYDEMCEEGETQLEYIEKLWKIAQDNWEELSVQEFELLSEHIFQNDYPLSKYELEHMLRKIGFLEKQYCFRDETKLFVFMDIY